MSSDYSNWGQGQVSNQKVVAMNANDAKLLVDATVAGVTRAVVERSAVEALEAYKQTVRLEAEASRLREALAQRDTEIAGLRQHIERLSAFISSMQPASQYNNSPYGMIQPQTGYIAPQELLQVPASRPNGANPE